MGFRTSSIARILARRPGRQVAFRKGNRFSVQGGFLPIDDFEESLGMIPAIKNGKLIIFYGTLSSVRGLTINSDGYDLRANGEYEKEHAKEIESVEGAFLG